MGQILYFFLFSPLYFLSFFLFSFLPTMNCSGLGVQHPSQTTLTHGNPMPCVLHALLVTITNFMHDEHEIWLPMYQVSTCPVPHGTCPRAMCHNVICPFASKNVKFRLSRNSLKFNCVPRFREMN